MKGKTRGVGDEFLRPDKIVRLATNNGDMGGGEIMLLSIARRLQECGISVQIIGPSKPSGLVDAAQAAGFSTLVLSAHRRLSYMFALRRWRLQHRGGLLWCNGLVPSLATAFMGNRIVHLHQVPRGNHIILTWVSRMRACCILVPSQATAEHVPGSTVLENWVDEVRPVAKQSPGGAMRLGFLGRPSLEKGVGVLAAALQRLDEESPGRYRLVLAGESRFTSGTEQREMEHALMPVKHLIDRPGWMEPAEFFGSIDVMVCPSVVPESFGLVVAEAMSARIPFVISDAGALPEVAGPDCPWVVPAGDAGQLAEAISKAADDGGSAYASAAYERWRSCYSPTAGATRLETLLRQWGLNSNPALTGGTP